MFNINAIYFFTLIFVILILLKHFTKFLKALLQKEPEPIVYSNFDLIILGLSISYIITYILYK